MLGATLSVMAGIRAKICIKMRNNTSEQAPLCWFDLRWSTRQKGQCRAYGPHFRSQEAPNPAELTETSLCAEAETSLTLQALACTRQKAFGHWGWLPVAPTGSLWHLQALCYPRCRRTPQVPRGPRPPIRDAGSPRPLPPQKHDFLAPAASLHASVSASRRPSCLSSSLIRLQAAGMQELLAIFMDPLICHWKTEENTQTDISMSK